MRAMVDLPLPDSPTSENVSRARRSKATSRTTQGSAAWRAEAAGGAVVRDRETGDVEQLLVGGRDERHVTRREPLRDRRSALDVLDAAARHLVRLARPD